MSAAFPVFAHLSESASLTVALGIGLAFGAALERAGLGSATKLVGQFYLTDLAVLKVMFSAIVTAMLGLFWLGRLGVVDLARIYVPETYVAPQAVGGAVFGVGFVLAGLCPGTSCVAAATGRGDGAMTVAGMFSGILLAGLVFAPLAHFAESTGLGVRTLPQALHLSYGTTVALLVAGALTAFRLAELVERDHRPPAP
jgi:uncharacterized membrane protein YedE/YeeE